MKHRTEKYSMQIGSKERCTMLFAADRHPILPLIKTSYRTPQFPIYPHCFNPSTVNQQLHKVKYCMQLAKVILLGPSAAR